MRGLTQQHHTRVADALHEGRKVHLLQVGERLAAAHDESAQFQLIGLGCRRHDTNRFAKALHTDQRNEAHIGKFLGHPLVRRGAHHAHQSLQAYILAHRHHQATTHG